MPPVCKRPAAVLDDEEDDHADVGAATGRNAAQNVMDCLKGLDQQGRPYLLQAYKNCKSWADKRKFAQQLMLDKSAFLNVEEDKEMTKRQEIQKAAGWCYLWDVARLNGISFDPSNEKQMQMLKTFVAGCETKPSPDPLVADQGWLLYYYSKEFESQEKFVKGTLGPEGPHRDWSCPRQGRRINLWAWATWAYPTQESKERWEGGEPS